MDPIIQNFYELAFKAKFYELKGRGDEFQNFFSTIMELRYPGDFMRIRTWGNIGDKKNDGFLASEKTVFAVYSPYDISGSKTINKMENDFQGALNHWEEEMKKWIFVHNGKDGISPPILEKILELRKNNQNLIIKSWGYNEIRRIVLEISLQDLINLFGPSPSKIDFKKLDYSNIGEVLENIAQLEPILDIDISIVSSQKMKFNGFSIEVQNQIRIGLTKAKLVKDYIESYPEPDFGQKIAASFNAEYIKLKERTNEADEIFFGLVKYTGGLIRKNAKYEASVFAVLAHLFESCDIFENIKEVKKDNIT